MKKFLSNSFIKAAGIRAMKTFFQTALAMIGVNELVLEIDWIRVLSVSATAAVISVFTSLAGLPEVSDEKKDGEHNA